MDSSTFLTYDSPIMSILYSNDLGECIAHGVGEGKKLDLRKAELLFDSICDLFGLEMTCFSSWNYITSTFRGGESDRPGTVIYTYEQ